MKKSATGLELVIVPELVDENRTDHIDDAISALYNERNWSLLQLRKICRTKSGLETLYQKYQIRLRHSYFIVYLFIQALLSALTITVECAAHSMEDVMDIVLTHGIVLTVCFALLIVIYDEKFFLQSPPSGPNLYEDRLRSTWVPKASTVVVFVPLLAMQIITAIKYANDGEFTTHWDSSFYLVLVCYIFFPLKMSVNAVLALLVSLVPVVTSIYVEASNESGGKARRVIADALVIVAGNGVGLYFCFMTEIAFRRSFLDKRASIVAKCKREYEEKTEEHLLSSIIPETMVKELRKSLREAVLMRERNKDYSILPILPSLSMKPFANVFAQYHENVSILYADIVNFTPLTASMNEEDLVRLLNDLFGKFDEAVKEFNCLRIKLLGDCYYCVSGIPESTDKHAWNCVNAGMKMIAVIREVRQKWDGIDVDMRIGIHSGSVYSCILGISKWQFDIWSTDAKIANHLEQAGRPGCVHISRATQRALGKNHGFYFETGRKDSYLKEKGVQTFFIPLSQNRFITLEERFAIQKESTKRLSLQTPQWLKPEGIQPYFVTFRDLKLEWDFIRQPDMLIKYPVLAATILIFLLGIIVLISQTKKTEVMTTWGVTLLIMLAITFWAWIGSIHAKWQRRKNSGERQESSTWKKMEKVPRRLVVSPRIRIALFLVSAASAILVATISLVDECPVIADSVKCSYRRSLTQEFALVLSTIFIFYRMHFLLKLGGMVVTLCIYGILGQKFFFDGLRWDAETRTRLLPQLHYLFVIFLFFHFIDRQSEYLFKLDYKWEKSLEEEQKEAKLTRSVNRSLIFNILPSHLAERYLNPEHEDELYHERYSSAAVMFATILDFSSEEEVDSAGKREEPWTAHPPGAEMKNALTFLNSIISDFDEVRSSCEDEECIRILLLRLSTTWPQANPYVKASEPRYRLENVLCFSSLPIPAQLLFSPFKKVQKIKLIGTTYMAAVGLEPGKERPVDPDMYDVDPAAAALNSSTMVAFAVTLIDRLQQFNRDGNQNLSLRIGNRKRAIEVRATNDRWVDDDVFAGIACGPLVAGVVGAEKPLYDIWGDTVNMASRLESTGERWKIHIMEDVNNYLRQQDIGCVYRGLTKIKGKGHPLPTYFVDLDRFRKKGPAPIDTDDLDDSGSSGHLPVDIKDSIAKYLHQTSLDMNSLYEIFDPDGNNVVNHEHPSRDG
ncbi:unnamed protein product [Darwinula stevensoni]|uniref:adenylate cyclase n=1 Tax=Darwinula stevensoni TaxID=69355 RepID=A0A7R8XBJ9_9CRUS|nr:unnamed protein product [Darwinula stevensoni]CAG0886555.1 unnamed protein product [Darwinula stevensoni]